MAYETLRVGPGLHLDAVALLCGTTSKEVKQLNREIKTGRTPLNKKYYDVQIPVGTKQLAKANLPRLNRVASTGYGTHVIQRGDTISGICRRYNINKTTLLKINNLRTSKLIAGKHLRIPQGSIHYRLLAEGEEGKIASNEDLILYTIEPGETVTRIADKFNVPADLIVAWNGLQSRHRIRAGQQLSLYIEGANTGVAVTSTPPAQKTKAVKQSGKRISARNSSMIVLAEQKKFHVTVPEQQVKNQVTWYRVRPGDSLWAIARKFDLSTSQLKSWNNLKSNQIHPGIKLKINNV